jgi:hypothetical protein
MLKSRVSFIWLKPVLNNFLRGVSVSNCHQHSLKVLLLLNAVCLLKYVLKCEQSFSFLIIWSRLTITRLASVYCTRMSCTLSSVHREDMKCRLQIEFLTSWYINALLCHMAQRLESFNITEIWRPFSASLFTVAEQLAYIITSDIM